MLLECHIIGRKIFAADGENGAARRGYLIDQDEAPIYLGDGSFPGVRDMSNATLKARDRVKHNETGMEMVIVGLGDIDGRELAWCQWRNGEGYIQQTTFPVTELNLVNPAAAI